MVEGYVLAIDRSTDAQSVALACAEAGAWRVCAEESFAGLDARSGAWAAGATAFLRASLPAGRALSAFLVGTGPGSFAGIRASLAFAQGYAVGSGCGVFGLPSPCACAREEGPFAVVGDARRGERWVALFEGRRLVRDVFCVPAAELEACVPRSCPVTSPDGARIGAELAELFESRYDGGSVPSAAGLVRFASASPRALVREPLPLYLHPAVRDGGAAEGGRP